MFLKEIILDVPLGKTKYHIIRVELQVRGTPHIHSFLRIVNEKTTESYAEWLDQMISAELPDEDSEPTLFELNSG